MPDPVKPLNRLKPFTRINNDGAIPKDNEAPDGDGVSCGCHTPDEFAGQFQQKFKRFLEDNIPAIGPLVKFLKTLNDVAKKAADILNTARIVAIAAATALGAAMGGALLSLITALAAGIHTAEIVSGFIEDVTKVIDTAISEFVERIGEEIARRAIRVIPQWVPVQKGASNTRITADQVKDVEGIVTRSYCDPIEPPFFQWHHWLNWSIQLQPEERYKNVLVSGFELNTEGKKSGETAVVRDNTFEIQWDGGALWLDSPLPPNAPVHVEPFEASFEEKQVPEMEGPFTSSVSPDRIDPNKRIPSDWLWPMTGMYVWASGRWTYDCSRTDKLSGSNPKMCTMMNPPRAIATASWEAVQFSENLPGDPNDKQKTKVPAIRFMFFTCKRGGYLSYDSISDEDYEFILDLPPIDVPVTPFPIGHTTEFPHNTIVLRPRLLRQLQPLSGQAGAKLITPVVTVLPPPPDKPGAAPQQVKVTIRASDIGSAAAAGFVLSLGWFDPNRVRAAAVKDCTIRFTQLQARLQVDRDSPVNQVKGRFKKEIDGMKKTIEDEVAKIKIRLPFPPFTTVTLNDLLQSNIPGVAQVGKILKDAVDKAVNAAIDGVIEKLADLVAGTQTEEWLLHVGVNGRWQTRFFGDVGKSAIAVSDPYEFKISLGPDDLLFFASNGVEFNPVGDMMLAGRRDRLLKRKRDGHELTWNEIVSATGQDHEDIVFSYALDVLTGNSSTGLLALGIENAVLGLIEPGDFSSPGNDPATSNPLSMKTVQPGSATLQPAPLAKFAEATSAIPSQSGQASSDEAILVEDPGTNDYRLAATIDIQNQLPKK